MWKIRDTEIQVSNVLFNSPQFVFDRFDPLADVLHGCHVGILRLVLSL